MDDIPTYAPPSDDEDANNHAVSDSPSPSPSPSSPSLSSAEEEIIKTSNIFIPRKRPRLPKDTAGKLLDRLDKEGPHAPLSLYNDLIAEYSSKSKLDEIRAVFERSLKAYPTVASQWTAYADMELSAGEFARADEIYRRAVASVTSLAVYAHYLTYVRRRNVLNDDSARQAVLDAFELVTAKVGIDVRAGPVWKEYLDFIKSVPDGNSTWEAQQKMDRLRKVYQRAVCIPLDNLETLWQEYNSFENALNKTTARKFLAERAPAYMTARSCLKDLLAFTRALDRRALPTHAVPESELAVWNKWIAWERADPLGFTAEDGKAGVPGGKPQLVERVLYVYKQALQPLRYCPQVWFEAAEYAAAAELPETQLAFLTDGVAANPTSLLLNFRLAEVHELAKKRDEAKKTYQTLAETLIAAVKALEPADPDPRLCDDLTLCYTAYMRAMKRMEGLKAARQVFSDARKLPYSTHVVFVASALMEYHHNKTPEIASKIFEIGLRRFADSVPFVSAYLDFLISTNDDTNARALFERTVARLPAEQVKILYDKFYAYEATYGTELASITKLESRMLDLYHDTPLASFERRYGLTNRVENQAAVAKPAAPDLPMYAPSELKKPPSRRAQKRARDEADKKRTRKKEQREPRQPTPDPPRDANNALPDGVMRLLELLPPASAYTAVVLDPDAVARLIDRTRIPIVPPANANLARFKRQ